MVFETDDEAANSPSRRRSLLYELYNMGLLAGEDGKVSDETRGRILNALGFANLAGGSGLHALQESRAAEENRLLRSQAVPVEPYDDDGAHIAEHTRYVPRIGKALQSRRRILRERQSRLRRAENKIFGR